MDNCKSKCYDKNTIGVNPSYLNEKKESFDFCFDDIFNEKSTSKCTSSNYNLFIPNLNTNTKQILNQIYDIKNWEDSYNYINKYKNISNKYTLERIIKYSWESFYDSYKINMDYIIQIYALFFEKIKKNIKIDKIKEIVYKIKKDNIILKDLATYHEFILNKF
jgi:hypothetical protein